MPVVEGQIFIAGQVLGLAARVHDGRRPLVACGVPFDEAPRVAIVAAAAGVAA